MLNVYIIFLQSIINFDGSNLIAVKVYDSYDQGGIVSGDIGLYGGKTSVNLDVNLQSFWKFHPGDDLRRKESDFDDSGWPVKYLSLQNGKIRDTEIMTVMPGIANHSHSRQPMMKKWFCSWERLTISTRSL